LCLIQSRFEQFQIHENIFDFLFNFKKLKFLDDNNNNIKINIFLLEKRMPHFKVSPKAPKYIKPAMGLRGYVMKKICDQKSRGAVARVIHLCECDNSSWSISVKE
jgi:hypothetical protein